MDCQHRLFLRDKSSNSASGSTSTSLNDGLIYGNYPYGTRVQDKIISLNAKKKINELLEFIAKKDKKKSEELFKICQKELAKVRNKGILKKKKISRKVSSLNKKIKTI